MWRSFWTNPGARDGQHSGLDRKLKFLQRAVVPQIDFRCSRWPPQKVIAEEVAKMLAILIKVPRIPGELPGVFCRRRARIARRQCRQQGIWSERWFTRAIQWDEHLARPRNAFSWPASLRKHQDEGWFAWHRSADGRTQTRCGPGRPQMRWHRAFPVPGAHSNRSSFCVSAIISNFLYWQDWSSV